MVLTFALTNWLKDGLALGIIKLAQDLAVISVFNACLVHQKPVARVSQVLVAADHIPNGIADVPIANVSHELQTQLLSGGMLWGRGIPTRSIVKTGT